MAVADVTTYKLSLAPGQHSTTITATDGARWTLTATYAHVAVSNWGINKDGLRYGVSTFRHSECSRDCPLVRQSRRRTDDGRDHVRVAAS